MDPIVNLSQPVAAYADPQPRIRKLEDAVSSLQTDYALPGPRLSTGLEILQAQLALSEEKLRREFHDGLHRLEQVLIAKIEAAAMRPEQRIMSEVQTLNARIDQQDARLDRQDARQDRQDAQMDKLNSKIDQLAKWMIATQLTTIALITGIAFQLFLH